MYIKRKLQIAEILKKKSVLLLGPRQTGKSRLIRHELPNALVYNLLEADTFLRIQRDVTYIRKQLVAGKNNLIVIDEIQKIPELMDEVHLMIEEHDCQFLLTGSSSRSLQKKGVNKLGGRLRQYNLHPFSYSELKEHNFDLSERLQYGLIPSIVLSDEPTLDLKAYVSSYIQNEVIAEGAIKNIPAFGRFLEVAALSNGEMINYTNIGNDAQVARTTVVDYYKILEQTLLGCELSAWNKGKKRKPITTSKFYLFDMGVINTILERKKINRSSEDFGNLLETFIFHELKCYQSYIRDISLNYWRTKSDIEVDFILDNQIGLEVKATRNPNGRHVSGLKYLMEEQGIKQGYLACLIDKPMIIDGVTVLPWDEFLQRLWNKKII